MKVGEPVSRVFRLSLLIVLAAASLCWVPVGTSVEVDGASSPAGVSIISDAYWPLGRNGTGELVFVSADLAPGGSGLDGYGYGPDDGQPHNNRTMATDAGDFSWGSEVDRRLVHLWGMKDGVWDLGQAYSQVVVFPCLDGGPGAGLQGEAIEYVVWGSNSFDASHPAAAKWQPAYLAEVYTKGWSNIGEQQYPYCSDDYVTVWGWQSSGAPAGGYRFIKLRGLGYSTFTDPEIDAVKGARSADCGAWDVDVVEKGRTFSDTSLKMGPDGRMQVAYGEEQLFYAVQNGSTWHVDEVDNGGVGAYCSLATDNYGCAISYYDAANGDLKYAFQSGGYWVTQTVDADGDVGQHTSIAFSQGGPRISYYDATNSDLRFAYWDGIGWAFETVDSLGWVGEYTSLAILEGVVEGVGCVEIRAISYYDATNEDLKLAVWSSLTGNWVIDVVDSSGDVGRHSSLCIAHPGIVAVAYQDATAGAVKYAWSGETGWEIEVVDDDQGWLGEYVSLAFGWDNEPSVGYYDSVNQDLKYAHRSGAGWNVVNVDSGGNVGSHASLTFDAYGNPAISYYDGTEDDVKVAVGSGSGWNIQTVDPYPWAGRFSSLAFDNASSPAVSFYDARYGDLKYANWQNDHWAVDNVDSGGNVGAYTSLAFDSDGSPCISYYEVDHGDLKYARGDGTTWQVRVLDSDGDVGSYSSLAFDNFGNAVIAYYDATNGDLKFWGWNGEEWAATVVDAVGDVGSYASLDVDVSGNAGISYYDATRRDLKYAHWNGSTWDTEIVDSGGDVGRYCSLQFDCLGYPAICYFDVSRGDLKYAHWSGTNWEIEVIESQGQVGLYPSLKFDSAERPAVSYHDASGEALKLARWNGEKWNTEIVDYVQMAGHMTSLAFDNCSYPAISYDSPVTGDLKYARPSNPRPDQPDNLLPGNGEAYVSLAPILTCAEFSDPCTDSHLASQWVITTENCQINCDTVFDSGVDTSNLLRVQVPADVLQPDTIYYWCVRHQDCRGTWSKYSVKTAFTTGSPPERPWNESPADGAAGVLLTPTLMASPFADPEPGDSHLASEWQITTNPGDYSAPVLRQRVEREGLTELAVRSDVLLSGTTYYWRVRYQDNHGTWSEFSWETSFSTNIAPATPSGVQPANGASKTGVTPTLQGPAFVDADAGETHRASQWRITGVAGDYSSPVFDSGEDTSNLTRITVPSGKLEHDTTYYWQVRYQDSQGSWSDWSAESGFSTGAAPTVPAGLVIAAAAVAVVAVVAMVAPMVAPL